MSGNKNEESPRRSTRKIISKISFSGSNTRKSKSEHDKLNEKQKKVFGLKLSSLFSPTKKKSKDAKKVGDSSENPNKTQFTSTPFKMSKKEEEEKVNDGASTSKTLITPEIWNNSQFSEANTSFKSDILHDTVKDTDSFMGLGRKVDEIIAEIHNLPVFERSKLQLELSKSKGDLAKFGSSTSIRNNSVEKLEGLNISGIADLEGKQLWEGVDKIEVIPISESKLGRLERISKEDLQQISPKDAKIRLDHQNQSDSSILSEEEIVLHKVNENSGKHESSVKIQQNKVINDPRISAAQADLCTSMAAINDIDKQNRASNRMIEILVAENKQYKHLLDKAVEILENKEMEKKNIYNVQLEEPGNKLTDLGENSQVKVSEAIKNYIEAQKLLVKKVNKIVPEEEHLVNQQTQVSEQQDNNVKIIHHPAMTFDAVKATNLVEPMKKGVDGLLLFLEDAEAAYLEIKPIVRATGISLKRFLRCLARKTLPEYCNVLLSKNIETFEDFKSTLISICKDKNVSVSYLTELVHYKPSNINNAGSIADELQQLLTKYERALVLERYPEDAVKDEITQQKNMLWKTKHIWLPKMFDEDIFKQKIVNFDQLFTYLRGLGDVGNQHKIESNVMMVAARENVIDHDDLKDIIGMEVESRLKKAELERLKNQVEKEGTWPPKYSSSNKGRYDKPAWNQKNFNKNKNNWNNRPRSPRFQEKQEPRPRSPRFSDQYYQGSGYGLNMIPFQIPVGGFPHYPVPIGHHYAFAPTYAVQEKGKEDLNSQRFTQNGNNDEQPSTSGTQRHVSFQEHKKNY